MLSISLNCIHIWLMSAWAINMLLLGSQFNSTYNTSNWYKHDVYKKLQFQYTIGYKHELTEIWNNKKHITVA